MKIIERSFSQDINVSAAVALWNYWDHEHLTVVHDSYQEAQALYEKDNIMVQLTTFKVPVFSFLTSNSMSTIIMQERNGAGGKFQNFNIGFLGIPSIGTIEILETSKDSCKILMNYKFFLRGWRKLMAPIMYTMMEKWNTRVWLEDLPLKIRRQKVLRAGFRDFIGMPEKVSHRNNEESLNLTIPIPRPKKCPFDAYRDLVQ